MVERSATGKDRFDAVGSARWLLDPLGEPACETATCDGQGLRDLELVRIVLVAIETGARFHREGIALDPLAWMVTPRRMFRGLPPIEACVTVDGCSRALLVQRLGLGLDPEADAIDLLLSDDDAAPPTSAEEGRDMSRTTTATELSAGSAADPPDRAEVWQSRRNAVQCLPPEAFASPP